MKRPIMRAGPLLCALLIPLMIHGCSAPPSATLEGTWDRATNDLPVNFHKDGSLQIEGSSKRPEFLSDLSNIKWQAANGKLKISGTKSDGTQSVNEYVYDLEGSGNSLEIHVGDTEFSLYRR